MVLFLYMSPLVQFVNNIIYYIIDPIIALIFALSFLFFVYGAVRYFTVDSEAARTQARWHIIHSLFAFLIMLGVTTVLAFLLSLLGITVGELPTEVGLYF